MTSQRIAGTTATTGGRFPDFPSRDDMQNPIHLHKPGYLSTLHRHFGNSDSVLVMGEVPVGWNLAQREGIRIPDLLVAFDVDSASVLDSMGYAIDRQGKPPDFALEVASPTTGMTDYTAKRHDYAAYGVTEYWRFDPSGGRYHDVPLAGDRLVDGVYVPVEMEWTDESRGRGYSQVLGLYICWEMGQLRWYNPQTGAYLLTSDEEAERADREAEARGAAERRAALEAEARAASDAEVERLRQRLEDLGESTP